MPTPPRRLPLFDGVRWLELSLDYRCNLRCLGCRACAGGDEALSPEQALSWMRQARLHGVERLWLGGGEPTLRPDLPALARAARALGFRDVLVQTNGMRLAYPGYTDALLAAGVSTFRLNLKSVDPDVHDALCASPGAHALLERALDALASRPCRVEADVLLTRSSLPSLPATVRHYARRGVRSFSLWLLSAHDSDEAPVRDQVPRASDALPLLLAARQAADAEAVSIESLHTPWCLLPGPLHDLFRPASSWGLLVVDASSRAFSLDGSPIEGGAYLPGCGSCSRRPACPGPRPDYLAIHGPDEFAPL